MTAAGENLTAFLCFMRICFYLQYLAIAGMKKFWFKDDEGYQIFARWVWGTGDWLDAPFGNYLMKSNDLKGAIRDEVNKILKNCTSKINTINHEFHAELNDNGYKTGYELLHGTNKKVGDFRITGKIIKKSNQCFWGSLKYQWNDIIDSNPTYWRDIVYDVLGKATFYFSPRDYTIRISFSSEFNAKRSQSIYI